MEEKKLKPVEEMTDEELSAEIHAIDPVTGRLVDAFCAYATYEAELRARGETYVEEVRREQREKAEAQLERLAKDLEKQRRPLGLFIKPNSKDFEKRIREEIRQGKAEKFPETSGFRKRGRPKGKDKGKVGR